MSQPGRKLGPFDFIYVNTCIVENSQRNDEQM